MQPSTMCHHHVLMFVFLVVINRCKSSCVKVDKEMFIQVPNYRTAIVHTNACREELSATIEPNIVFVGNMRTSSAYVKEYRDTCCCKVMNSSRHTVQLDPQVNGEERRLAVYWRIDNCGCITCDVFRDRTEYLTYNYIRENDQL